MFVNPSKENGASAFMQSNEKTKQLASNVTFCPKDSAYYNDPINGVRNSDHDNWLKAGANGPLLLTDHHALRKLSKFDHERIPERVVHARGAAAHGHFKLHTSLSDYTYAEVLTDTSLTTPMFTRFSTVLGSRGAADTNREVRGFSTRFYTQQGNWDIVGNNIPIFFIQDGIKFPDLIHAGKPAQTIELPQSQTAHDGFWDFISRMPESNAMAAWILSSRTIPRSFRHMQGFGVNSFILENKEGKRHFVKFHWSPKLGTHSLVWDEALKLAGQDPDFHRRDLAESIAAGAYPQWELGVQLIPEENQDNFEFSLLDCTKLVPEELVPIKWVGTMTLDQNPTNYHNETEQVAYCTSNIVPGMDFSNDPMLQSRNFSYHDTQISRLGGINYSELPINRPVCPVFNTTRDGYGNSSIKAGPNYNPNKFDDLPKAASREEGGLIQRQGKLSGECTRSRPEKFAEHLDQSELFYNGLSKFEQAEMVDTATFELDKVQERDIQIRTIQNTFNAINHDFAKKVGANFSIEVPPRAKPHHGKSTKVSLLKDYNTFTAEGRKVAIFCFDGYDPIQVKSLQNGLLALGIITKTVSTRRGPQFPRGNNGDTSAAGVLSDVDFTIETCRSGYFDALFFPSGDERYTKTLESGRVLHFIREAFGHLKTIGACGEAVPVLAHKALPGCTDIKADPTANYSSKNGLVLASSLTEDESGLLAKISQTAHTASFGKEFVDQLAKHKHWERDISSVAF